MSVNARRGRRPWRPTGIRSYRFSPAAMAAIDRITAKVEALVVDVWAEVPIDVVVEAGLRVAERYLDEVVAEVAAIRRECDPPGEAA